MLRPKEMVRVLLVGPRDRMDAAIETLHDLKLFHVVQGREEDEVFSMGKPLERAEEVSETLVKLRSIASLLDLGKEKAKERPEVGPDIRQRILTLEVNIREEEESRKRIDELLRDLNARIESLRPFAALGLDLRYYRGYESLAVFVGRVPRPVEGVEAVTEDYELVQQGNAVALFVPVEAGEEASRLLAGLGFASLEIPAEEGDPRSMLEDLLQERERWQARLQEVRQRLATLRERYAGYLLAAEDVLAQEIEKAEAPLLFVTSDHSFVADGWVPKESWPILRDGLAGLEGLYVELQESEEEEPPVLLDNPKPVRPFELLTNLFSTPSYKEIDPTVTLFLVFPFFFGFMVGDLGYGIILAVIGALGYRKLRDHPDLQRFMGVVLVAGVFTAAFGGLLYGDAFGIPFEAPAYPAEGGEVPVSWEGLLGMELPIHAIIHKTTDITELLILSIIAAFIHLGLGFVIGFFNEVHHSRKHATAKAAWLAILLGLFVLIMARVDWHPISAFLWQTVLLPIPKDALTIFGFDIPWASFGLVVGGGGVMAVMEGIESKNPVAIVEIASLLANMISYTRLAGLAVAKAAIAEALNNSIFHGLIFTGSVGLVALGFLLLFGAQMIVLLLGSLSSGIQALRLNYVEFFMKFFHGNGIPFQPFGVRTTGAA